MRLDITSNNLKKAKILTGGDLVLILTLHMVMESIKKVLNKKHQSKQSHTKKFMKNIYNTFKLRTNKRQLYNFTTWHEGQ